MVPGFAESAQRNQFILDASLTMRLLALGYALLARRKEGAPEEETPQQSSDACMILRTQ